MLKRFDFHDSKFHSMQELIVYLAYYRTIEEKTLPPKKKMPVIGPTYDDPRSFFYIKDLQKKLFFISVFADIPQPGQTLFQDPATPSMIGIIDLHHEIMFYLVYVLFFVFQIMAYEIYYFSIALEESQTLKLFIERCRFAACPYLEGA